LGAHELLSDEWCQQIGQRWKGLIIDIAGGKFEQRVVNDSGKDPSGEKKVGRKKGCPRVLQTPKGGVLLLQDIIRELNIKAALNEVMSVCASYSASGIIVLFEAMVDKQTCC
jgi:hypothetical protein